MSPPVRVMATATSSSVLTVCSSPEGLSLTPLMVSETVATCEVVMPSLSTKVKWSVPPYSSAGALTAPIFAKRMGW